MKFFNISDATYIIIGVNNQTPLPACRAGKVRPKERTDMITVSVKGVLIGILLIALIVLVVFLIVMAANVTDTFKKANAILDGGTGAAKSVKETVDGVGSIIREKASQIAGVVAKGVALASNALERFWK